jgi:hypothetical protein
MNADYETYATLTLYQQLLYLGIMVPVTVWVGRTLFKSGAAFLAETFRGKEALAESVNRLLVVGFYLMNLGFVALGVGRSSPVYNAYGVVEQVSSRIGLALLMLGTMHFFNLLIFARIRRRGTQKPELPPIHPSDMVPVRMSAAVR